MPDLVPTGSEAEWLEARRKGITASEIAIVMGLSPYSSPYALYHQKLGILPDQADQAVFERGRVLEPYIAEKFAAAHPEFIVDGTGRELFAQGERPWQLATPDRLLHQRAPSLGPGAHFSRPSAVAEFKTDAGSDEWGEPGTDEIPVHYRAQVLWQMDVMGVSRAYVSCLDPARWQIREYVIEHDPAVRLGYDVTHTLDATGQLCDLCADILAMRAEALEFLGRIDRQEVPDVDWRPATADALKQLHPSLTDETAEVGPQLADRYEAALRNYKKWERRKKLYEAQLRQAMGSARRVVRKGPGQIPLARRDVYEVRESVRKAYTVDKLVAVPPKKDRKHVSADSE